MCLSSWRPEHWIYLTDPKMQQESVNATLQLWAISDLWAGAGSFCDNRLFAKGQVLTWEMVRPWKDHRIWTLHSFRQYQACCLNFSDFFSWQLYAPFKAHLISERTCGDLQENMEQNKTNNETRKHEYRHNRTNKPRARSAFKNEAKLMCTITIYTPSYEEPER